MQNPLPYRARFDLSETADDLDLLSILLITQLFEGCFDSILLLITELLVYLVGLFLESLKEYYTGTILQVCQTSCLHSQITGSALRLK